MKITIKPKVSLSAVRKDIDAALNRQAIKDAAKISVEINGSEVILGGTVQSWFEKKIARQSAWNTPGVFKVVDNIKFAV